LAPEDAALFLPAQAKRRQHRSRLQGLDPVMRIGMRRAATSASSSLRNDRHSPPNPIRPNKGAHYQTLPPQPEELTRSPSESREARARVGVIGRMALRKSEPIASIGLRLISRAVELPEAHFMISE
jgi:hypothetical protein